VTLREKARPGAHRGHDLVDDTKTAHDADDTARERHGPHRHQHVDDLSQGGRAAVHVRQRVGQPWRRSATPPVRACFRPAMYVSGGWTRHAEPECTGGALAGMGGGLRLACGGARADVVVRLTRRGVNRTTRGEVPAARVKEQSIWWHMVMRLIHGAIEWDTQAGRCDAMRTPRLARQSARRWTLRPPDRSYVCTSRDGGWSTTGGDRDAPRLVAPFVQPPRPPPRAPSRAQQASRRRCCRRLDT